MLSFFRHSMSRTISSISCLPTARQGVFTLSALPLDSTDISIRRMTDLPSLRMKSDGYVDIRRENANNAQTISFLISALEAMNRNARRGKKANKGKRPNSRMRRRFVINLCA